MTTASLEAATHEPRGNFLRRSERWLDEAVKLAEALHHEITSLVPNLLVTRKWNVPFYKYLKNLCYMNYYQDQQLYIGFMNGKQMQQYELLIMTDTTMIAKYYVASEQDIYHSVFAEIVMEAIDIQESMKK